MGKPFEFEHNGEHYSFPSEEAAAKFFVALKRIESGGAAVAKPRAKRRHNPTQDSAVSMRQGQLMRVVTDEEMMTFRFLEVIRGAGPRGAESDATARVLNVQPKGIGSRLTRMRTVIEGVGFDPAQVYTRVKLPGVGRFWKAGPQFSKAYEAIKKSVETES